MSAEAYISISLQVFGILVSIIIILFLRIFKIRKSYLDFLYTQFVMCNVLLQTCNVLSWLFDRKDDSASILIAHISTFLMYALSYLLIGTFCRYFFTFLKEKNGVFGKEIIFARVTLVVSEVLVVLSLFTGLYYRIDAYNVYSRGNFYWLSGLMGILLVLAPTSALFKNWKRFSGNERFSFLLYISAPFIALIYTVMTGKAFPLHIVTTVVVIGIYVFIQSEQTQLYFEKELELEKTRSAMIIAQIQPHFLYNSLLSIKQLCDTEPKKAAVALEHFSYYLRGNLDSLSNTSLIEFKKEFEYVEDYLFLEKMRFEDRLQIEYNIQYEDFLIPTLTLQTIVENAVRHGVMEKKEGGTIRISVEKINNQVCVSVEDTGVGYDVNQSLDDGQTHIGIRNVKQRILAECNGSVIIESKKGKGTKVKIYIPLKGN